MNFFSLRLGGSRRGLSEFSKCVWFKIYFSYKWRFIQNKRHGSTSKKGKSGAGSSMDQGMEYKLDKVKFSFSQPPGWHWNVCWPLSRDPGQLWMSLLEVWWVDFTSAIISSLTHLFLNNIFKNNVFSIFN